jgi:hypothetical protein
MPGPNGIWNRRQGDEESLVLNFFIQVTNEVRLSILVVGNRSNKVAVG